MNVNCSSDAMATGDMTEEVGGSGISQLLKPSQDELRERSLSTSCPAKVQGFELRFLSQPEEQHRARYMTEGSRGAIKDRTQKDHPRVKVGDLTAVNCVFLRFAEDL